MSKRMLRFCLFQPKVGNKFNGYIPMNQLKITYSRSSGPGGQNVNCVDTKVDIRFHVKSADWLSEETKNLLIEQVRMFIQLQFCILFKVLCK